MPTSEMQNPVPSKRWPARVAYALLAVLVAGLLLLAGAAGMRWWHGHQEMQAAKRWFADDATAAVLVPLARREAVEVQPCAETAAGTPCPPQLLEHGLHGPCAVGRFLRREVIAQ